MFPHLRQSILARADLLVELATLGEYGISEDGRLMALEPVAQRPSPLAPRLRDECGQRATVHGRAVPARS